MDRTTENKLVIVTQKTRLEQLVYRYNTESQAQFYIEHHGGDFSDYKTEHETYYKALHTAVSFLETFARLQIVDREQIPNYLFGADDLVIAVGRDGLVANVLKYLTTQKLIGVNPDPRRWDGVLLPFSAEDLSRIVPEVFSGGRRVKPITLALAELNDGQTLCAVNDLFIGQKTHASARYEICHDGKKEIQSSSGIIVSTGLGSTGWLKSVIAGAAGIGRYCGISTVPALPDRLDWASDSLYFTVREPFPSRSTGADIVLGRIEKDKPVTVTSFMPENGVIFSDGVESDRLEFNSGASASVKIADRKGNLIV